MKRHYPEDQSYRASRETIDRGLYVQPGGALEKGLTRHLLSRRSIRRSRQATRKGHGKGLRNLLLRAEAMSVLVAAEAARNEEFGAFRRDVLRDELIGLKEVKEWIENQLGKSKVHYRWIRLKVDYSTIAYSRVAGRPILRFNLRSRR